jgi:hypothetical protein
MEFPDQLRTPAPTRRPGIDALDDLLWEAASWDSAAERVILEASPEGTDQELVGAARRLLDEGLLTEPALAYRVIRVLADLGELRPGRPAARAWPTAGLAAAGRIRDLMRLSGPVAGSMTGRAQGVSAALRKPGVQLLSITGPAGAGKTRLALDIAAESRAAIIEARRQELSAAGRRPGEAELERAVPLLQVCLRSAESGAGNRQLGLAPYDALLDLLGELGVPEADMPATLEARRASYLAELRNRHPVIVVDDACDESQVLPLLPPEDGVVLVTSRGDLTWQLAHRAANPVLAPLDKGGIGSVVLACFAEFSPAGEPEMRPDDATVTAIHGWCDGLPRPAILVSRWIAAAARAGHVPPGQLTALIEAARPEWEPAGRGAAPPGFPAVAAVLGLLGEDQQSVLRLFGLLRIPEADLQALSIGTGLSRDRVRAALGTLAELGLLARAESGSAWSMPAAVAGYARGWALGPGQDQGAAAEPMLGPLIGLYRLRVSGLRDALPPGAAAPAPEGEAADRPGRADWAAAEWTAARDVLAGLLDAAAVTGDPARAGGLAAAYLEAAGGLDGSESGWREADRYTAPVLAVARTAGDPRLAAGALRRLGRDAERQGQAVSATELLEEERPPVPSPDPGGDTPGPGRAPETAEGDGLARVASAASAGGAAISGPLLFGAGARLP